jgi:hypothetical protein
MFANAPVVHGSWPDRDKLAEKFVVMRKASLGKEHINKWFMLFDFQTFNAARK